MIRLLKMTLSSFSHLILMLSSLQRKAPYSFSFIFLLSRSYTILTGKTIYVHFPSQFCKYLSLREKPDRAWGTWKGPLRQNCGVLEVYVLRQVSAAVARGGRQAGGAGRRGAVHPVWLLPSPTASPPLPLEFAPTSVKPQLTLSLNSLLRWCEFS